ncbi:MAG: ABC transporter ATP-binding protein [SAR324 cluster bacterium]|nr:ABC transporter ATP-binding protein [SAR324 cluster bacterium]
MRGVHAFYGSSHVLHGVSLRVEAGEIATLLGRNGMGKTTTLRTILGLVRPSQGSIEFDGSPIAGARTHRIARMGIGWVPEDREIFPNLTVEENLVMAARRGQWTLGRVYELFPNLGARRRHWGDQLSGGEAQMLAIGRALLTQPRLLLMDEATEGLSPLLRQEIWRVIEAIREQGVAILLVDKHIHKLLSLAGRHTVLSKGRVAFSGTSDELRRNLDSLHETLAI